MAVRRGGLGRGLDALIRDVASESAAKEDNEKKSVKIEKESKSGKKTSKSDADVKIAEKINEKPNVKVNEKMSEKVTVKESEKLSKSKASDKTKNVVKKAEKNVKTETRAKTENRIKSENPETPGKTKASAKAEKPVKSEKTVSVKETSVKAVSDKNTAERRLDQPTDSEKNTLPSGRGEQIVRISLVEPNRSQPRKTFSDESISELADSIRQHGVIQPLLVQAKDDHYEIIAGERRWRASKEAGLKEIPIIVRDYSSQEAVEVSLIENIQREDLNPIEEAKAYRNLMTDFSLRQEDVAQKVSKSRAAIANSMRLLKLDIRVQDMVIDGQLSEGHARALLVIEDGDIQLSLAEQIVKDKMSVRQVEALIRQLSKPARPAKERDPQREAVFTSLSEKLKATLGTKVTINQKTKHKGVIEIEYYSDDDLERVYEMLVNIHAN